MTLRDYMKVFSRHWVLVLVIAGIAALATWIVTPANSTANTPQSYTATSTLLVSSRTTGVDAPPPMGLSRVALYITTGVIPQRAASALGFDGDPAALARQIVVMPDPQAMSMTISASDSDPEEAAALANTFTEQALTFFDEAENQVGNTSLELLQPATALPDQGGTGTLIPPGRLPRTLLAAFLGLMLGFATALVVDRIDSRLRGRREIQEALRMPIVAEIPKLKRDDRERAGSLVAREPLSVYADGYRAARTAVTHTLGSASAPGGQWDSPPTSMANRTPVVLVTSASPGEGKTTSVANLAASFAETGKRVLVIDGDLRSPSTHNVFDVPQGAGISNFLSEPKNWQLHALMRPTSVPGVQIITAGTELDHPVALASRMGPLLVQARDLADVVIVDSAPMLAASDIFDVLPLVDTVLLVARSGRITESEASRVAELLGRFRVPVAGAIIVGSTTKKRGYGYGQGYGESRARSGRRLENEEPAPQIAAAPEPPSIGSSGGGDTGPPAVDDISRDGAYPVTGTDVAAEDDDEWSPYELPDSRAARRARRQRP